MLSLALKDLVTFVVKTYNCKITKTGPIKYRLNF